MPATPIIVEEITLATPISICYKSVRSSYRISRGIYKESVELTFVYLNEGCGKTHAKINDTIPHTVVDMGFQGAECTFLMNLHEVSVVPYRPLALKLPHFLIRTCEKHFHNM